MTLLRQWLGDHEKLEPQSYLFVAFPGVGNVGKSAIDELLLANSCEEVLRLHPLGLPPLAELDNQGLLSPPHLKVHHLISDTEPTIYTLSGPSQPNQALEQSNLAREILSFAREQDIDRIFVFAGLMDDAERKETFAVATTEQSRIRLLEQGVDVRDDEPRSGAIGVSALITSLGPVFDIDSCCVISSTVGASTDVHASLRLLENMKSWFSFQFHLPEEDMIGLRLRSKLQSVDVPSEDYIKELTSYDTSYM